MAELEVQYILRKADDSLRDYLDELKYYEKTMEHLNDCVERLTTKLIARYREEYYKTGGIGLKWEYKDRPGTYLYHEFKQPFLRIEKEYKKAKRNMDIALERIDLD